MSGDAVSHDFSSVVDASRQAAARLEVIGADREAAARSAGHGWTGTTRVRFDRERARQAAFSAHLVAQGRRLAAELEPR